MLHQYQQTQQATLKLDQYHLILSGIGLASMWLAVFADTGVTLLTIINTTRILKK